MSLNENRITNYEDAPAPVPEVANHKAYMGQTGGVSVVDSGYDENVNDIHNYPAYTDNWLYVNIGSYKYLDYGSMASTPQDLHAIARSQYPPVSCSFRPDSSTRGSNSTCCGRRLRQVKPQQPAGNRVHEGDYRASRSQLDYWSPANPDANHYAGRRLGPGIPYCGPEPLARRR